METENNEIIEGRQDEPKVKEGYLKEIDLDIIQIAYEVLVLFYTEDCNKCHFREKELSTLKCNIAINKIDASKYIDLCNNIGVNAVPTLVLFREGEDVKMLDEISNNKHVIKYFRLDD